MTKNHRKTNQNLKLDRKKFDDIFSSEKALDTYTTALIDSVRKSVAPITEESKRIASLNRNFPKTKASVVFDIDQLFPPMNVKEKPQEKEKNNTPPVPEKPKQPIYKTSATTPPKTSTVSTTIERKPLPPKPTKTIVNQPLPIQKEAPAPAPLNIEKKRIIKSETPITQHIPETAPVQEKKKRNPIYTVSSDDIDNRLKKRQDKIQDLFDKKGNIS